MASVAAMDIHPGPLLLGLVQLGAAIALPRTHMLNKFENFVIAFWGGRRRIDPESTYARFDRMSWVVALYFFGVLFLLWGLGIA
jgi:hypothetical protein